MIFLWVLDKLYWLRILKIFSWIEFWRSLYLYMRVYVYFITWYSAFWVGVYFSRPWVCTNKVRNDKMMVQPISIIGCCHSSKYRCVSKTDTGPCVIFEWWKQRCKLITTIYLEFRQGYPKNTYNARLHYAVSTPVHLWTHNQWHSIKYDTKHTLIQKAIGIQAPHLPLGFICKGTSNSNYISFSMCKVRTSLITRLFWTKVVSKDSDQLSCGISVQPDHYWLFR